MALERIGQEGVGALIYLPQEGRGIGLLDKIRAYRLQDEGLDTVDANIALGFRADLRDYGIGLQILKDLGLTRIRLLTNNPKKTDAFVYDGYDLQVVEQVPIVAPDEVDRRRYMAAKRDRMGHQLPDLDGSAVDRGESAIPVVIGPANGAAGGSASAADSNG